MDTMHDHDYLLHCMFPGWFKHHFHQGSNQCNVYPDTMPHFVASITDHNIKMSRVGSPSTTSYSPFALAFCERPGYPYLILSLWFAKTVSMKEEDFVRFDFL